MNITYFLRHTPNDNYFKGRLILYRRSEDAVHSWKGTYWEYCGSFNWLLATGILTQCEVLEGENIANRYRLAQELCR